MTGPAVSRATLFALRTLGVVWTLPNTAIGLAAGMLPVETRGVQPAVGVLGLDVADARGGNIHHYTITLIEMGRPNRYQ